MCMNFTGEDNEVENGFDHLADTNIHSDDDELLLPDDSHLSKLGHETNSQYSNIQYRCWDCKYNDKCCELLFSDVLCLIIHV